MYHYRKPVKLIEFQHNVVRTVPCWWDFLVVLKCLFVKSFWTFHSASTGCTQAIWVLAGCSSSSLCFLKWAHLDILAHRQICERWHYWHHDRAAEVHDVCVEALNIGGWRPVPPSFFFISTKSLTPLSLDLDLLTFTQLSLHKNNPFSFH